MYSPQTSYIELIGENTGKEPCHYKYRMQCVIYYAWSHTRQNRRTASDLHKGDEGGKGRLKIVSLFGPYIFDKVEAPPVFLSASY